MAKVLELRTKQWTVWSCCPPQGQIAIFLPATEWASSIARVPLPISPKGKLSIQRIQNKQVF